LQIEVDSQLKYRVQLKMPSHGLHTASRLEAFMPRTSTPTDTPFFWSETPVLSSQKACGWAADPGPAVHATPSSRALFGFDQITTRRGEPAVRRIVGLDCEQAIKMVNYEYPRQASKTVVVWRNSGGLSHRAWRRGA
jgi:hypothetical protein